METDHYKTRHTLIERACSDCESGAWDEFFGYYEQFVLVLLKHLKVPEQERDEIAQQVRVKVWKNLSRFDSGRAKFRTWLVTVIRNTTATHMRQLSRRGSRFVGDEGLLELFADERSSAFEQRCEREWKMYLTSVAMNNIKSHFSAKAIEAFRLSLGDASPQQISDQLGIHLQSVYKFRNRVKSRLVEEINYLRGELEF